MEKKVKNILVELKGNHPAFLIIEYTDGTKGTLDIKRGQKIADVLRENVRKGTITLEGYNPKKEIKVVQAPVFNADSLKDSLAKEKKLEEANKEIATLKNKYGEVITINTKAFSEKKTKKILIWSGIGVVTTGLALAAILAFKSKKNNNLPTATPTATMSATATPEIIPTPEIAVTPSATQTPENYDINLFDNINDSNKLDARIKNFQSYLYSAVKGTKYEESTIDTFDYDSVSRIINYYSNGNINGFEASDSLEYLNYIDTLVTLEGHINKVLPLWMLQLDGTRGQKLAKEIFDARVKMMNGQNSNNQALAEEGASEITRILYESYVIPGFNGAISETSLESSGAKTFNLKYILTSNGLVSEINEDVVIIDACGENLSWRELYGAVNSGGKLEGHEDELNVPITSGETNGVCNTITWLSSYAMGASQEILDESRVIVR